MSYIPDYRKETSKLNAVDNAYIGGYRKAIEDAMCFFEDNLDDDEMSSIEKEAIERVRDCLADWMEVAEIIFVFELFDNADYLPDDIELEDGNKV